MGVGWGIRQDGRVEEGEAVRSFRLARSATRETRRRRPRPRPVVERGARATRARRTSDRVRLGAEVHQARAVRHERVPRPRPRVLVVLVRHRARRILKGRRFHQRRFAAPRRATYAYVRAIYTIYLYLLIDIVDLVSHVSGRRGGPPRQGFGGDGAGDVIILAAHSHGRHGVRCRTLRAPHGHA
jgi:hypothetical protein